MEREQALFTMLSPHLTQNDAMQAYLKCKSKHRDPESCMGDAKAAFSHFHVLVKSATDNAPKEFNDYLDCLQEKRFTECNKTRAAFKDAFPAGLHA